MARTRTTIRRIDPWSILKFGFVANLVLLGIQLLAGAVVWYVIQRLELIQTVCELAATVGFEECGVDGSALFDTFLVLGLLGVVIQTGIMVFLTFLANLIFDLTGGITLTLDDESGPSRSKTRSGIGTRATGASSLRGGSTTDGSSGSGSSDGSSSTGSSSSGSSSSGSSSSGSSGRGSLSSPPTDPIGSGSTTSTGSGTSTPGSSAGRSGDDDTLFGSSSS